MPLFLRYILFIYALCACAVSRVKNSYGSRVNSIYDYLENTRHMAIVNSKHTMTVEKITEIDGKYMDLNVDDYNCVAVVSSSTYNNDSIMFEYTQSRHRPD